MHSEKIHLPLSFFLSFPRSRYNTPFPASQPARLLLSPPALPSPSLVSFVSSWPRARFRGRRRSLRGCRLPRLRRRSRDSCGEGVSAVRSEERRGRAQVQVHAYRRRQRRRTRREHVGEREVPRAGEVKKVRKESAAGREGKGEEEEEERGEEEGNSRRRRSRIREQSRILLSFSLSLSLSRV